MSCIRDQMNKLCFYDSLIQCVEIKIYMNLTMIKFYLLALMYSGDLSRRSLIREYRYSACDLFCLFIYLLGQSVY